MKRELKVSFPQNKRFISADKLTPFIYSFSKNSFLKASSLPLRLTW